MLERVLVPALFLIIGFCLGCGKGEALERMELPEKISPEERFLLSEEEWLDAMKNDEEWTPDEKRELNQALNPDEFERLEGMYRWKGRRPGRE